MSKEQYPEVWKVGPVEDPGVVLGPPMPAEEFPVSGFVIINNGVPDYFPEIWDNGSL
jgi:hypothetical protein